MMLHWLQRNAHFVLYRGFVVTHLKTLNSDEVLGRSYAEHLSPKANLLFFWFMLCSVKESSKSDYWVK